MLRKLASSAISLFLLVGAVFPYVQPTPVHAAEFDDVILFLERTKVSESTTPLLVVIEPSTLTSGRTEDTFRITFKVGFTVNSTASAIQTSTSGLPSTLKGNTLTAMPGLSATASSVVGQQVEFDISDLSDGNYYAFYITSGITNPSSAGNHVSPVATRDGSGDIDTASPGIGIENIDQVSVTATIPPKSTDGSISITSDQGTRPVIHDGDIIEYTVSYRNEDEDSHPFQVIASWEKGTVVGTSSQVDIFDYVVGSASTSEEGNIPYVDIQNSKIYWTIPSVSPSSEYKTVTFKLKVRSDIPRNSDVNVDVNVNGTINETALSPDEVSHVVRYKLHATSTPFHPSASPTPTREPGTSLFDFEFIRMLQVTDVDAIINVRATNDAQVLIRYGRDVSNLNRTSKTLTYDRSTQLKIADLISNTQYYFTVEIVNRNGERRVSDLLSFTTAGSASIVDVERVDVLWEQLVLTTSLGSSSTDRPYNIFAPHTKPLVINIQFDDSTNIEEANLKIAKKGVLGIASFKPQPSEIETRLIESLPNQFVGELMMPDEMGEYQLILTVKNVYGGFFSQILDSGVYVMDPIMVVDSRTGKAVEAAKIDVSSYSQAMKLYTSLDEAISYEKLTDENGSLVLALAEGKYRADVSALGYGSERVEFVLDETHPYPKIELDSEFNFITWVQYYTRSIDELGKFVSAQLFEISVSQYGRSGLLVVAVFMTVVLLGTVSLGRYHISLLLMPFIFIYMMFASLVRFVIHGRGIHVYAMAPTTLHSLLAGLHVDVHGKRGTLLKSYTTDIAGSIYIPRKMWEENKQHLKLVTDMEGFKSAHFDIGKEFHTMKIRVRENHKLQGLYHILDHVLILINFGLFFTAIVLTSLIFSWMMFYAGFGYAIVFIVLNLINFFALYLYVKDVSHIINERGYI